MLKGYQNSIKNHKSPETIRYFKTRVNTVSIYTPQMSPNFTSTQPATTCLKLTIETLEQGVKSVQI